MFWSHLARVVGAHFLFIFPSRIFPSRPVYSLFPSRFLRAANTVSKTVHGLPDGRGDNAAGGRLRPILDDGTVRRLPAEDQRLPQVALAAM